MNLIDHKLKVVHYAQIPCKGFEMPVKDEYEAFRLIQVLSAQHLFLEAQNIIPDYSNSICVFMYEENEWVDYYNEKEGLEWEEMEHIINKDEKEWVRGLFNQVKR